MWRRKVAQPGILFRRDHSPDVRWTVPSVYFRTIETDTKHMRKILASLFRGRSWSIRYHSDCTTRAERIKRSANIYLHCIVSNLKKISKMSTLPPPGKMSADAYACAPGWGPRLSSEHVPVCCFARFGRLSSSFDTHSAHKNFYF